MARWPDGDNGDIEKRFPAATRAVPASSRGPNDPTAIFAGPHDYHGSLCQ
jgi:hypothetical protein